MTTNNNATTNDNMMTDNDMKTDNDTTTDNDATTDNDVMTDHNVTTTSLTGPQRSALSSLYLVDLSYGSFWNKLTIFVNVLEILSASKAN